MKKLLNILFWSVISAAFIGPGTITTAASAGAGFRFALLWALVFSTIATLVLQEASARLTIGSDLNLGQAIRKRFHGGFSGGLVLALVLGAIVFGCAAYQTGNILGGVNGVLLESDLSSKQLTLGIGMAAGVILWLGSTKLVSYILSVAVAFMGIAFLVTAVQLGPNLVPLFAGAFVPSLPANSSWLVLGLVGTTVVPYNLFLGSSIARGQKLGDMRLGLSVSVIFGGVISMAVLVVGTAVEGNFDLGVLANTLAENLGGWARWMFAYGLFAAGFSSAITAPLAAALTARSLFAGENAKTENDATTASSSAIDDRPGPGNSVESSSMEDKLWGDSGILYRGVWLSVLLVGVGFGLSDVRPVPAIILAQALNGIILPFIAVFLLVVVNDRRLMDENHINGICSNTLMTAVTLVAVLLGAKSLYDAAVKVYQFAAAG